MAAVVQRGGIGRYGLAAAGGQNLPAGRMVKSLNSQGSDWRNLWSLIIAQRRVTVLGRSDLGKNLE